ncbi:ABC transporter permease [Oceanicella sp. SM1341]|uniref:ABC transporter permease n=1 Tax=Oceanicella sp. SM1341 TaxID=1548889 RepID=UPI000E4DF0FC|nr:ABC transporter permease [Oceanicella sp. SM1341]
MSRSTAPFAGFEWLIAWRYLKARRREGGVSVMTWISLVGITLAVFALVATFAVRTGFRAEFTDRILGANAHVTLYNMRDGRIAPIPDFDTVTGKVAAVPGVVRAAPMVSAQVMATARGRNAGVQVFGERRSDLETLPLIANPESRWGSLDTFGGEENGIAIGSGVARELGLFVGDTVTLISPDGVKTAFGATSPRINNYKIAYIFQIGRYDIDRVRVYLPLEEAQKFFNHQDTVDQIEVMVARPEGLGSSRAPDALTARIADAVPGMSVLTWKDTNGAYLQALTMEDNVMFVILSILVLIASLNITSGLVMLVKNKGRDVGVLRSMGLTQGSILRVFFICGASIGVVGTILGVVLGCLFAIYIDPIFTAVNDIAGGGVWDPSQRLLSQLPAKLVWWDVFRAAALSFLLACVVTIFPARRAARLNPVEALRYE